MRRDHAPLVAVDLRRTDDPRTDELRRRFDKALKAQRVRNAARDWRDFIKAKRDAERKKATSNVFEIVGKARG